MPNVCETLTRWIQIWGTTYCKIITQGIFDSQKIYLIHKLPVCSSSRQYLNTWIFAEKSGKYLLLLSRINYDWEKNCAIRSHLKVFVTIAVLSKNPVDYKSMSLAKSLFTCFYDIVCSYIKKNRTFLESRSTVYRGELWKQTRFLVRYSMLIYLRIVKNSSIGLALRYYH